MIRKNNVYDSMTSNRQRLKCQPYLHFEPGHIFNPLTDLRIRPRESGFRELRKLFEGKLSIDDFSAEILATLLDGGWLVKEDYVACQDYSLRFAAVEASTHCNQSCYFCPVSIKPRNKDFMSLEFFESIIHQLSEHRKTLLLVSLFNYNEPTADKRLDVLVKIVRDHGLPPGINTNASGLTPSRIDALHKAGGLRYMSINLNTLDRETYKKERGQDHLPAVLKNLDYLAANPLAERIDMAVLGRGDSQHQHEFEQISQRFRNSPFLIKKFEIMDRSGHLSHGCRPPKPIVNLAGCMQTGSRPVQWVHITPQGKCVLCCQDYSEENVVGDLNESSLREILSGPKMAQMRRWVYGEEKAPDDFICRRCLYARSRNPS